MRKLVIVSLFLLAAACGGSTNAGDNCDQEGAVGACASDSVELVCESSHYREVACKGAGGCQRNGSAYTCDVSGDEAGDPCSAANEGRSTCTSVDSTVLLTCNGGSWASTACDSGETCEESAGAVACQ